MGGWGWVESRIRLISAKAEAEALLGLAELGNIEMLYENVMNWKLEDRVEIEKLFIKKLDILEKIRRNKS